MFIFIITLYWKRDSAKWDSAKRDSAKWDSEKRDSANGDSSKQDSAKRDSAKRDSAKRDSAKRDLAKRDSAKREDTLKYSFFKSRVRIPGQARQTKPFTIPTLEITRGDNKKLFML